MRRGTTAILVTAALAAASVAEAAVTPGTYKGSIKGGGTISLKIDSKKRIVKLVRRNFEASCDNGGTATFTEVVTTGRASIRSDGTFVWKSSAADVEKTGHSFRLAGTVRSPKASGTLKESQRYDAAGEQDPNGSITCTTPKMKWSAKRQ